MNWIIFGVIFILSQPSRQKITNLFDNAFTSSGIAIQATPIPPNDPFVMPISPFIRHWEAARFDADAFRDKRHKHDGNRRRRGALDVFSSPANAIKLNFTAHNRQFNILLREDPKSIFSPDVQIENTLGPFNYDTSRVYTGTLEDDENAIVHGVITEDNLFDGSIHTNSEHYYIEPAHKYSSNLNARGIHSVVYKTSDVHQPPSSALDKQLKGNDEEHFCASERLRKKITEENNLRRKRANRSKRWMPDEISDSNEPPLPLDLDVPYNDDFTIFTHKRNKQNQINRKSILLGSFDSSDFILRNSSHANTKENKQFPNNSNSSRPIHKTHVEIITKNGATKKPNIIGSNYNPDMILTRTNFHHYHHQSPSNANNINGNESTFKSALDRKSTCMLYLQADHTFFEKMGSEEASIEAITRHVQRANSIYKNTDFNGDGKPDNITFMIKRIKVHTTRALDDKSYRFPGNYGVEKFLEIFSEEDYDAFCLAYMFTYRDFEMGTLGLAWTGDLKNAGGVCEKNGHYRGSLKSLNTGIVTLLNYGKHVPPAVSHVTLAHEIGHNFGSPHDPEQCTPGGEDGNFIMFARATSGDKKNNNKFSPCSLKAIEPVLNAKARSSKGCFTEPQTAICGNGVVEPGEECDCGWEEDCKDKCCYPMSTHPPEDHKPCKLRPRANCSPSQGPCCTTECTLKFGDRCRDDNGCRDPSYCDGRLPFCPPSHNKPNKTICNKEFVCYMGECTGSICLAYGLESCQCIPREGDPKTKACELCCKLPGEENKCKSSFEWNLAPYDVPDMYAKPGTPCNDYNGYCDVFQKCREVDPSGPLATLRKLLLSEESIASFKKWIVSNIFTIIFFVLIILLLIILMARLFGKKTNRKLKSVTIIHSATTETVRLPEDNNGVIVHTAVRTKVPFKMKVRGERSSKSKNAPSNGVASGIKSKSKKYKTPSDGLLQAAVVATGSTNHIFKRQISTSNETTSNTKTKKVKRASQSYDNDAGPSKGKSAKSKSSKHKEIIDYSKRTAAEQSNAIGKVHQWLQDSPIAVPPPAELEQIAKKMNKSQSTPERMASRVPKKSKSANNLDEKVKLQVVYKPPFKFSFKLSKNPAVKTKVVGTENTHSKRKRIDKIRKARDTIGKSRRAALLIRSKNTETDGGAGSTFSFNLKQNGKNTEDLQQLMPQESNYETLNTKASSSSKDNANDKTEINTNTFRINKSSSGHNIVAKALAADLCDKRLQYNEVGSRNSTTNLAKRSGSSSNLMRSSTTNLSKANSNRNSFDVKRGVNYLSRSNTTNINKERRYGSHLNLLKHQHLHGATSKEDVSVPALIAADSATLSSSNSRRNSSTMRSSDFHTHGSGSSRASNNFSAKLPATRNDSSRGNIPRASLNLGHLSKSSSGPSNLFMRQTSLQTQPTNRNSVSHRHSIAEPNVERPHTAECNMEKQFNWSPLLGAQKTTRNNFESVPSDPEARVPLNENLVTTDKK